MKNKCLVIGGNGFIGKNLVFELLSQNFIVYVVDKSIANFENYENENLVLHEADVNDTQSIIGIAEKVSSVVWLIHTTVPSTSMIDVEADLQSNVPPLIRFIQEVKKVKSVTHFLYLSSGGTVYGDPTDLIPIPEEFRKDPISSYGLTKLIAEEYINFLLKGSPIHSFILRPSNVYGRYQNLSKPQGIIGHIFKSAMQNTSLDIYGDGSIIRDYVHVIDLAKAIVICLNSDLGKQHPLILNIGSGAETSINDILRLTAEIIGKPILHQKLPDRGFDCQYNVLSIEKTQKELNWVPVFNLIDGLKDVWTWIKETN
jgi:UDP-glucose 4-epimerase